MRDRERLSYEWTHHNWEDVATAELDRGTYAIAFYAFGGDVYFRDEVTIDGGEPIVLGGGGCRSIPDSDLLCDHREPLEEPDPEPEPEMTFDECFEGLDFLVRTDPPLSEWDPAPMVDTFEWITADEGLRIRAARGTEGGFTYGGSETYHFLRFAVQREDAVQCITDRAELDYDNTHHNWDDTWVAHAPDAEYTIRRVYDFTGPGEDMDETVVVDGGEPVALLPVECDSCGRRVMERE